MAARTGMIRNKLLDSWFNPNHFLPLMAEAQIRIEEGEENMLFETEIYSSWLNFRFSIYQLHSNLDFFPIFAFGFQIYPETSQSTSSGREKEWKSNLKAKIVKIVHIIMLSFSLISLPNKWSVIRGSNLRQRILAIPSESF